MAAVLYRTRWLLRRAWRSTIVFAVVAGVVAGLAMSVWASGRRSTDAYRRFVRHVATPQYAAFFCAPDDTATMVPFPSCTRPSAAAELAFLRSLPGVEKVAEVDFLPVAIDVAGHQFRAALSVTHDGPIVSISGEPLLVEGHLPQTPDQLAVNVSAGLGLPIGTVAKVQILDISTGEPVDIPVQNLELVGVGQFPVDLAVAESKLEQITGIAFLSSSWWDTWGAKVSNFGTGVLAQLRPGISEDSVRAAVAARWPGRTVDDLPERDSKADTVSDAIGYESECRPRSLSPSWLPASCSSGRPSLAMPAASNPTSRPSSPSACTSAKLGPRRHSEPCQSHSAPPW